MRPPPVEWSDGVLYMLKSNSGLLSTLDAKTGKAHYELQRLSGLAEVFSSPVGGDMYLRGFKYLYNIAAN